MKRILLVICCALLLINTSYGQFDKSKLEGNWYSIGSGNFIRMSIHNDTIVSDRLRQDMSPQARVSPKYHIEKVVELNKNIYVLQKQLDSTQKIKIMTILSIDPEEKAVIAANGISRSFKTLADAEGILKKDVKEKYGLTWYTEEELGKLKKLKPVSAMSKSDFLSFIKDYYPDKTKAVKEADEKFGSGGGSVIESRVFTETLIDKGFSPILTRGEYEKIFDKYSDSKEAKEFLDKYKVNTEPAEKEETNQ